MKIKNEERKIKKEYAIKIVKESGLDKNIMLLKLMSDLNLSRRSAKEYLDVAVYEVNNERI